MRTLTLTCTALALTAALVWWKRRPDRYGVKLAAGYTTTDLTGEVPAPDWRMGAH